MELPVSLQILLTQEAYLIKSREKLSLAKQNLIDQLASIKAARNPLGKLLNSNTEADQVKIAELKSSIQLIDQAVEYTGGVLTHLRPRIEDGLEDLLRRASPEYSRGLAALSFMGDNERCLRRLKERVAQFILDVGSTRNMMAAGYNLETGQYRRAALEELVKATVSARNLEEEIVFFNKIAHQHAESVANTAFENVQLPELKEFPYEDWMRSQENYPVGKVQHNFTIMIKECEDLLEFGISRIEESLNNARSEHKDVSISFLHNYWKILRDYACDAWVAPERIDSFIEEIEFAMHSKIPAAHADLKVTE